MLDKISKTIEYSRTHGVVPMLRIVWAKIFSQPASNKSIVAKYDSFLAPSFGVVTNAQDLNKKSINWFIPPVGKGSGGHLNIFRFIRNLESLGYQNRIIIVGTPQPRSAAIAKKNINDWFFHLNAEVFIEDSSEIPPAFFAMATEWRTAYYVKRFLSCVRKCYFVQDFEPWFYAMGTDYVFAENTYRFNFHGFTAGSWIANKLAADYDMKSTPLGFSYDRELYNFKQPSDESNPITRPPTVFFYARPPTTRRAFELGILILREVKQKMPSVSIVMAGWDMSTYSVPFEFENAGLVELNKLNQLYKRTDVALVLSFSNVSLLPLELMACGVPVVSNKGPYTEWLLNETNSLLAESTVHDLAEGVLSVLQDVNLAKRLQQGGLNFANQTSWENEASKLAQGLEKLALNDAEAKPY